MNGIGGSIYKVTDWIMRMAYINLLWIMFTIIGLGIFGFFPAYTAMLSIIRKWLMGNDDIPVFQTFLSIYKREFMKSNIIGIIMLVIGYILYLDLAIVKEAVGPIRYTYFPLIAVFIAYSLASLYLFPILVHYNTKVMQALKNSLYIMILSPISTMTMIIGLLAIYMLMTTIPGLIPFFLLSSCAMIVMWSSLLAFGKIERKQNVHNTSGTNRIEV
ncbi:YesL family protein [Metabacillus malikii]|uniref:Membrane protein YesL n=1 Tax=Metabacillus malikii TaxID=1504265 RepID=A0ABT9ZGG3_9BACI|nr:YesL family protein [Metabacillus malikii]MDQ0231362.1 putative membrane protein YesL [Metabacillus malikii]